MLQPVKQDWLNISLPKSAFEFFNKDANSIVVTPGEYEVMYGSSSAVKDLKTVKITIQ